MRVYLVTADCLVEFCTLRWLVVAHGEREAWAKAWSAVHKCTVADEGSFDVKRISNAYEVAKLVQQGVKICE